MAASLAYAGGRWTAAAGGGRYTIRVRPKSPSLTVGVRKEPGFPPVLGRTLRALQAAGWAARQTPPLTPPPRMATHQSTVLRASARIIVRANGRGDGPDTAQVVRPASKQRGARTPCVIGWLPRQPVTNLRASWNSEIAGKPAASRLAAGRRVRVARRVASSHGRSRKARAATRAGSRGRTRIARKKRPGGVIRALGNRPMGDWTESELIVLPWFGQPRTPQVGFGNPIIHMPIIPLGFHGWKRFPSFFSSALPHQ